MSGVKKKRKKGRRASRTNRVFLVLIAVFVLAVMSVQLINLYQTDAAYAKKEQKLQDDLSAQMDRQEELKTTRHIPRPRNIWKVWRRASSVWCTKTRSFFVRTPIDMDMEKFNIEKPRR